MSQHVRDFVNTINSRNDQSIGRFEYDENDMLTYTVNKKHMSIKVPHMTSPTLARFIILYLVAKVALDDNEKERENIDNKGRTMGYFFKSV